MAIKIMLPKVRCAFLTLGKPEQYRNAGPFRWSATALVPYKSAVKALVDKTIEDVAKAQWDKKATTALANILIDPKACCWQDGKRKDYEGFEGCFFLTAHRIQDKGRPLVMDRDKSAIYDERNELYPGKAGILYSGCVVNMQVEIWAQDNANGKGIRATLVGIQKVADDQAFGGGARPTADDFEEIEEGADAEDLT